MVFHVILGAAVFLSRSPLVTVSISSSDISTLNSLSIGVDGSSVYLTAVTETVRDVSANPSRAVDTPLQASQVSPLETCLS